MIMFRIISLLGLAGIAAAVVWALRSRRIEVAGTSQTLRQQSLGLAENFRQWRSLPAAARLATLMRFFYLATLGCVLVLAITGFLPVIILGDHISDFALTLHMILAPLFAIGMVALAVFWAHRHRFNANDWRQLLRREKSAVPQANPDVWQKICFWSGALLAVPILVSIILIMYPLLGTGAQASLLHWHGYAGLLLLAVVGLHMYLILVNKTQKRGAEHQSASNRPGS
jgi:cytochrome b subunit of formate dehydrogenase